MGRKVSSLTDYGKISNALSGGKRGRRMSKGRDCVNKGKDGRRKKQDISRLRLHIGRSLSGI